MKQTEKERKEKKENMLCNFASPCPNPILHLKKKNVQYYWLSLFNMNETSL